jgi:hypothetical protein
LEAVSFDRAAEERTALGEADGLELFCDSGIVALANTLLGTLAGFATVMPDWRRTLRSVVGPEGAAEAEARVESTRARFRLGDPIGAVPHGGRLFGDMVADQNYQRRSLATQLLAATGRLVHATGRDGHCLVILSAEHLDPDRIGLPRVGS